MHIGTRITELRKARHMKLIELAEKSGVQIATLSRMEHKKMIGTVESHLKIAAALGIDMAELYRSMSLSDGPGEKVPAPATAASAGTGPASFHILARNLLPQKMMPAILRILPGETTPALQDAAGTEKFVYVLEGTVSIHIEEGRHLLSANQDLYFDASVKHFFENPGPAAAKVIVVTAPAAPA